MFAKSFRPRKGTAIAATIAAALAALGAVSVATGAIPSGSDGTITACYGTNGELRVIDTEKSPPPTCNKGWTSLRWNQTGPKGDPGAPGQDGRDGAAGEPGPRGPSNVYARFKNHIADLPDDFEVYRDGDVDLGSFGREANVVLPLPAGAFHIQAKAVAEISGEIRKGVDLAGCALVAGPNVDGAVAEVSERVKTQTLTMQVLHAFAEPGQAELRCTDLGNHVSLKWIKVHATQVASFFNPPAP